MFSIMSDSIIENYNIIIDEDTGFYNITNPFVQYYRNHPNINERIHIGTWSNLKSTQKLKKQLKEKFNCDDPIMRNISNDLPIDKQGVYVHKVLYYHFMSCIDPEYNFKMLSTIN